MKLVFAHDHIFKQDNKGNYFTAGSFNNTVWKRYLNHFSEVCVIARLDHKIIDSENTFNNFDLAETSFEPIPNLSGPISQFKNKQIAKNKIRNVLKDSDGLIARLPSEIGNLAIDVAKEMNKPYAVEVVACVWDALWNYGSIQAKVYAPIAMSKMKKRVKASPFTLYVTNEFLQKRYPSLGKTASVSNVEVHEILESSLSKRINKIDKSEQLYRIGMIGNLNNRIKGWDIAIKALTNLKRRNINFEFHILGDGDRTPWLEMARKRGIEDRMVFHGVLPGGDPVFNWLDNTDIYIQPSFQEGLPRAVIEAMSRGCPVIGSRAGGIPELIDQRCLHTPGDFKKLGETLENIMFDLGKAKEQSVKNFNKAKLYKKSGLDKKRNDFWSDFVRSNLT